MTSNQFLQKRAKVAGVLRNGKMIGAQLCEGLPQFQPDDPRIGRQWWQFARGIA